MTNTIVHPEKRRGGNHRTGYTVAELAERREVERAREDAERARWLTTLASTRTDDPEQTQPLCRIGQLPVVLKILGGRGLLEQVVEEFDSQECEWCAYLPVQPTSARITGDVECTECCVRPECVHTALQWIDAHDSSSDRDADPTLVAWGGAAA